MSTAEGPPSSVIDPKIIWQDLYSGNVEATGCGDALMAGHYSYTNLLNNRLSWRVAQGSILLTTPLLLGLAVETRSKYQSAVFRVSPSPCNQITPNVFWQP